MSEMRILQNWYSTRALQDMIFATFAFIARLLFTTYRRRMRQTSLSTNSQTEVGRSKERMAMHNAAYFV